MKKIIILTLLLFFSGCFAPKPEPLKIPGPPLHQNRGEFQPLTVEVPMVKCTMIFNNGTIILYSYKNKYRTEYYSEEKMKMYSITLENTTYISSNKSGCDYIAVNYSTVELINQTINQSGPKMNLNIVDVQCKLMEVNESYFNVSGSICSMNDVLKN